MTETNSVYAFDRDWTVDVRPHPERQTVPISWISQLKEREDTAVYAIGNQRLTYEIDIPGAADLFSQQGLYPIRRKILRLLVPADYYLSRFAMLKSPLRLSGGLGHPLFMRDRRERLQILSQLYPNVDQRVVVDDVNLSDVDGWVHYYPWDFIDAVENGTIEL